MKTCPICEQPMMHTRLYGYRCSNPEHAERANEYFHAWLNHRHLTLEQFIGGYPAYEQPIVRRVLEPDLPSWYKSEVDDDER